MTDKEVIEFLNKQLAFANDQINTINGQFLKQIEIGNWAVDHFNEQLQKNQQLIDHIQQLEAIITKLMEKHGYETLPDDVIPKPVIYDQTDVPTT